MNKCGTCIYYKPPNVMGEKYGKCTKEVRYTKVARAIYYACSSYRAKGVLD